MVGSSYRYYAPGFCNEVLIFTAEHELLLNNSEVNDSNLHETSEEILNPEVMENDFDTRSETSEQHSQDVLSGGGSEIGIYQYVTLANLYKAMVW